MPEAALMRGADRGSGAAPAMRRALGLPWARRTYVQEARPRGRRATDQHRRGDYHVASDGAVEGRAWQVRPHPGKPGGPPGVGV
eukprot:scaffold1237_cov403-Prasinococcus_capsulatus_cf.AAC.15